MSVESCHRLPGRIPAGGLETPNWLRRHTHRQVRGSQAVYPLEGLKPTVMIFASSMTTGSQAAYPLEGLKQEVGEFVNNQKSWGSQAAYPLERLKKIHHCHDGSYSQGYQAA